MLQTPKTIAERRHAEGLARGQAEEQAKGEADALRVLIRVRGLQVTDRGRQHVES